MPGFMWEANEINYSFITIYSPHKLISKKGNIFIEKCVSYVTPITCVVYSRKKQVNQSKDDGGNTNSKTIKRKYR